MLCITHRIFGNCAGKDAVCNVIRLLCFSPEDRVFFYTQLPGKSVDEPVQTVDLALLRLTGFLHLLKLTEHLFLSFRTGLHGRQYLCQLGNSFPEGALKGSAVHRRDLFIQFFKLRDRHNAAPLLQNAGAHVGNLF